MVSQAEDRQRRRERRAVSAGVRLEFSARNGNAAVFPATLVDLSDYGCGLETNFPLNVGDQCTLRNMPASVGLNGTGVTQATVVHCRVHDEGIYRSGLAFEVSTKQQQTPRDEEPAGDTSLTDYYEALQISPHADVETIQRVYRMLAQRYHPDNAETGNEAKFRLILQAYRVLSDAEKRAEYDARHKASAAVRWQIFDKPDESIGLDEEKRKRWGILSALYMKRKNEPGKPGMRLNELENLLGCPKEHLEFSLWYLRGKSFVVPEDNGRFNITPEGADALEEAGLDILPKMPKLLEAAHEPNSEQLKPTAAPQPV